MSRTSLYAVIGILAAILVALGIYILYVEAQRPAVEIRLDEQGISVDANG